MILLRILEHDLHRSRQGGATPYWIEVPAKDEFLPALVANSKARFVPIRHFGIPGPIASKLKEQGVSVPEGPKAIFSPVFKWDSDRLDDLIEDMCSAALDLSTVEGWGNVFTGRAAARRAFDYVSKSAGVEGQPHVCLVPDSWGPAAVRGFFGARNLDEQLRRYRKYCRIVPSKAGFPVFLSRPDFVGMYTQFLGGSSSIVLHNVRLGMGICPRQ